MMERKLGDEIMRIKKRCMINVPNAGYLRPFEMFQAKLYCESKHGLYVYTFSI